MDNPSGKYPERIRVGGIKISPELVQYIYTRSTDNGCDLHFALKKLAARNINISYLTLSTTADSIITSFCIESDSLSTVESLLHNNDRISNHLKIIPSVGSLTLFPHRNSISMLGRVLRLFGNHNLSVHGVCTSISALSLITDYSSLEHAITALEEIVELPENHAPFRQEFQIRQIGQ